MESGPDSRRVAIAANRCRLPLRCLLVRLIRSLQHTWHATDGPHPPTITTGLQWARQRLSCNPRPLACNSIRPSTAVYGSRCSTLGRRFERLWCSSANMQHHCGNTCKSFDIGGATVKAEPAAKYRTLGSIPQKHHNENIETFHRASRRACFQSCVAT